MTFLETNAFCVEIIAEMSTIKSCVTILHIVSVCIHMRTVCVMLRNANFLSCAVHNVHAHIICLQLYFY